MKKKTEKILNFMIRGEWYQANEKGWIKRPDVVLPNGKVLSTSQFSDTWILLGGSGHHWNNHITLRREEIFKNPKKFIGCLLWDRDHGTIRVWGGSYCGRIPRVQSAYIETVKGGK